MDTRYMAVGVIHSAALARTGANEALFYLDTFASQGDQVRTPLEPIADEL